MGHRQQRPACLAVLAALITGTNAVTYDHSFLVDSTYSFSWTYTSTVFRLRLELTEANPALGWVGWGLGEPGSGGMPGGDYVICQQTADGEWSCDDRYLDSVSNGQPKLDANQHWATTSYSVTTSGSNTVTHIELMRDLDTCDGQDRKLMVADWSNFEVDMLFAYGAGALAYHGPSSRWRTKVALGISGSNTSDTIGVITAHADYDKWIELRAPDYTIPSDTHTTYEDFIFYKEDHADLFNSRDIIAIEGVLDSEADVAARVHHFVLHAITLDANEKEIGNEVLYIWVPGSQPLAFPDNVGVSIESYSLLLLQVHYDNPGLLSNKVDDSGVRLYLTASGTTRPLQYGILQVGDGQVKQAQADTSVGPAGIVEWTYNCNPVITENASILSHNLHMHTAGSKMVTRQRRSGATVHTAQVEYYDDDKQDLILDDGATMQPGDTFETKCTYTTDGTHKFGLATSDEMCIDFIGYYPRSAIDAGSLYCGPQYTTNPTESATSRTLATISRSFGTASTCPGYLPPSVPPTPAPTETGSPVVLAPTTAPTPAPQKVLAPTTAPTLAPQKVTLTVAGDITKMSADDMEKTKVNAKAEYALASGIDEALIVDVELVSGSILIIFTFAPSVTQSQAQSSVDQVPDTFTVTVVSGGLSSAVAATATPGDSSVRDGSVAVAPAGPLCAALLVAAVAIAAGVNA